jgi:hypothetical protein
MLVGNYLFNKKEKEYPKTRENVVVDKKKCLRNI